MFYVKKDLHFFEAYPEVDVVPVRMSEAQAIAAVPLFPHGELLAVLILAAPSGKDWLYLVHQSILHLLVD